MKNKRISKILGWGLAAGLAFSLGAGIFIAPPAAALEMEWGQVTTPSWEDNVIVPGSDIYDYAVAPDGDTIYAVGAVMAMDVNGGIDGLSGSFTVTSGTVELTEISGDQTSVEGTLYGDACYLNGDFVAWVPEDCGGGWIKGVITGDPEPGTTIIPDVLEFEGMLYGMGESDVFSALTGEICVDDWWLDIDVSTDLGDWSDEDLRFAQPRVWMSTDGGYTWDDITGTVQDANNLPGPFIDFGYGGVAVAPDDGDWLVVAGSICDQNNFSGKCNGNGNGIYADDCYDVLCPLGGTPAVAASEDGGDEFSYAGDMYDSTNDTWLNGIFDVDVSIEMGGIHNIAVAGTNNWRPDGDCWDYGPEPPYFGGFGTVFRLEAGTWLTGAWEDTSFYDGWDDSTDVDHPVIATRAVIDVEFSTNFDLDDTIVCMGVSRMWNHTNTLPGDDPYRGLTGPFLPYMQSGLWETAGTWNGEGGFADAVQITDQGEELQTMPALHNMGLALPADYDGSDPGARNVFVYVDAFNIVTARVGGFVFRVENDAVSMQCGPSGDPLLASIDVHGDADTGKMMIGTFMGFDNSMNGDWGPIPFECCEGVEVYHTEELDFCCPAWEATCKPPSGPYKAQVLYTPDGDKAYAITSGLIDYWWVQFPGPMGDLGFEDMGGLCDESAFSVSLDDGVSFNQLGLIDTDIDWISDVAVCPDCETVYISTINQMEGSYDCDCDLDIDQVCACDSVWRSWIDDNDEIGDAWERVYHGDWSDCPDDNPLLLRLPCDDLEDCCTVYLGIGGTKTMFYSRDCGQCWNSPPDTKITIQDIAVETENVVYVLDAAGFVSTSTSYGRRASDKVDTGITGDTGHSITSCCDQGLVLVGGAAGKEVAWSDDTGETWTLTDKLPSTGATPAKGQVHVACDPVCTGTIYAAVSGVGIYRTTTDSGEWEDLEAEARNYYGIVMGRSEGTLYAPFCGTTVEAQVATKGVVVDGTVMVKGVETEETQDLIVTDEPVTNVSGAFVEGELVTIIAHNMWYSQSYDCYDFVGVENPISHPTENYSLDGKIDISGNIDGHPFIPSGQTLTQLGNPGYDQIEALDTSRHITSAPGGSNNAWMKFRFYPDTALLCDTSFFEATWVGYAGDVSMSRTVQLAAYDDAYGEWNTIDHGWMTGSDGTLNGTFGFGNIGDYINDDGNVWLSVYVEYDNEELVTNYIELCLKSWEIEYDIGIEGVESDATGSLSGSVCVDLGTHYPHDAQIVEVISSHLRTDFAAGAAVVVTEGETGAARNLTPCDTACCGTEDWDYVSCGTTGLECFNTEPTALRICGCTTMATNSVLWAINNNPYQVSDGLYGTLWSYEDCAAKIGPTLTKPADGATLACDPCLSCEGIPFTLEWERMCQACSYDIQIMDENEDLILEFVDKDIEGDPPYLYVDDAAIRCGYTYTWKVREADTDCESVHSPWSEVRSFTIEASAGALQLVAPSLDATNIPVTNVAFSWSAVPDATSYSFVLSPNGDLSGALASEDLSGTAYKYTGTLDYEGSYFWKVIAFKGTTVLAESNIWSFTARLAPEAPPPPPVVVEPTPPPQINIPPAQMITPTWIYAIIGIGCALAVVVIVLIVRTRRPS